MQITIRLKDKRILSTLHTGPAQLGKVFNQRTGRAAARFGARDGCAVATRE